MKKKMLPIGIDDFKKVREENYYYSDKSLMIKELLTTGAAVTLVPRPRRFGKTLNMTMLKYFFEREIPSPEGRWFEPPSPRLRRPGTLAEFTLSEGEGLAKGSHSPRAGSFLAARPNASIQHPARPECEAEFCEAKRIEGCGMPLSMSGSQQNVSKDAANRYLFDGLAIAKESACMAHQGKYPVIFLTLKGVKFEAWSDCYDAIKILIAEEFRRHRYLLEGSFLDVQEKKVFNAVIARIAAQVYFEDSLRMLTALLHRYHGVKPIILIDEYDVPIHAGFLFGYYQKVISFMRGLLCGGLKGNSSLSFGVLTGILRVAKESIFSGINNLKVCSLLNDRYADKFGFIEDEVKSLLAAYGLTDSLDQVRSWYNGYAVGTGVVKVYNPWSMLNFIDEGGRFGPYWVNTSDNVLIQHLVQQAGGDVKKDFELILAGQTVNKVICEDIVFPAVYQNTDAIWSFLVFAGYLTWRDREAMQVKCHADLCVPNQEVLDCFRTLVDRWFGEAIGSDTYRNMLKALAQGDVPAFEYYFQHNVVESMSYFDVTGKTPERVYHAYVLGLLVGLSSTHEVKSNRESGFGRYDVCLIPQDKGKPGVIIEFKAFNKNLDRDLKSAAVAALAQIDQMGYEAELCARGIQRIIKLAIVFKGKKVLVEQADERAKKKNEQERRRRP